MKRFHLVFGLAIIIIFLLTGQYMEYIHNRTLPDGPRVLYRSRHIYILLAGLLNLVIGSYFIYRPRGWRRRLQIAGSVLLIVAPVPLLAGFFYEPNRGPDHTTIAPLGIFALAIGTLFHFVSSTKRTRTETGNKDAQAISAEGATFNSPGRKPKDRSNQKAKPARATATSG